MALINLSFPDLREMEPNELAFSIIQNLALSAEDTMVEVSLLSLSFGEQLDLVLGPLVLQHYRNSDYAFPRVRLLSHVGKHFLSPSMRPALTFLDRYRDPATSVTTRILVLVNALLYVSTASYMAAIIWMWSNGNHFMSKTMDGLSSPSYDGRYDVAAFQHALQQQSWMLTIAIAIIVSVTA